jgi:hypothetical protein
MYKLAGLLTALSASSVEAQSWASGREDPALFHVVAIDRTGEADFPYGREDVAGDGLGTFSAAEASADLRTLYASAEPTQLWLRAYLAVDAAPKPSLRAFFFIDSDARASSGGPAQGMELDEQLGDDPTTGGYERAIGVRGNGMVQGVFEWDVSMRRWLEFTDARAADARGEAGLAADPLAIGAQQHGYVQIELAHSLSQLTQSCDGTLFVRVLDDGPAMRTFADDAPERFACRARVDDYEVPDVLRPDGCTSDAQCPGDGVCRDGACLFTFACDGAADCPSGYECAQGRCVRTVSGSCQGAADCDGLVCADERCVACGESGARACASGLACAPDGSCVEPGDLGGAGSGGGGVTPPGKVRGGAFSCALGSSFCSRADSRASTGSASSLAPLALMLGLLTLRRRRVRESVNDRRAP